jgi:hypothetical protein
VGYSQGGRLKRDLNRGTDAGHRDLPNLDHAVEKNYGKFSIYLVNRDKPPSQELERRLVDVVTHFMLPRCKKYKDFLLNEFQSGANTLVEIRYPSERPELTFGFWYDEVARTFGLDIWDDEQKNPYGSVWIPEENVTA